MIWGYHYFRMQPFWLNLNRARKSYENPKDPLVCPKIERDENSTTNPVVFWMGLGPLKKNTKNLRRGLDPEGK